MLGLIEVAIAGYLLVRYIGNKAPSASATALSGKHYTSDESPASSSAWIDDACWQASPRSDDDDLFSSYRSTLSSDPGSLFENTSLDHLCSINPANGLPMMGCVDIEGNPYGTDSSHWNDHSISGGAFMGDGFSGGSSLHDDSYSSSSFSSFGD